MSDTDLRFAAVGDLHVTAASAGTLRSFFAQASEAADALLLCGDLTDYGLPEEAKILADELSVVSVPMVAVLGNHDHEGGDHPPPRPPGPGPAVGRAPDGSPRAAVAVGHQRVILPALARILARIQRASTPSVHWIFLPSSRPRAL